MPSRQALCWSILSKRSQESLLIISFLYISYHYHCESAQLDLYINIGIPDFQSGHSTQISRIQHFNQVRPQKVWKFDESPSCRLYTAYSSVFQDVLSLEEQQRLLMARLLLRQPRLALWDEPLAALSEEDFPWMDGKRFWAVLMKAILPFYDLWRKSPFLKFMLFRHVYSAADCAWSWTCWPGCLQFIGADSSRHLPGELLKDIGGTLEIHLRVVEKWLGPPLFFLQWNLLHLATLCPD